MKRKIFSKIMNAWADLSPRRKKQIGIGLGIFTFFGIGLLILTIWLSLKLGGFLINEVKTYTGAFLNQNQNQTVNSSPIKITEATLYNSAKCMDQLKSLIVIET